MNRPAVSILSMLSAVALSMLPLVEAVSPAPRAETADRDKPINVESDRLHYDDIKRVSTFSGNVVLTKGTIEIRGDTLVVRQDEQGASFGTAVGEPATFRQKREGVDEWVSGRAQQIDYDGAHETVHLQRQAEVRRTDAASRVLEEVHGSSIVYESGSEHYTVEGAPGATTAANPSGRVRMVIQPRSEAGAGAAPATAPVRLKPSEQLAPDRR